MTITQGSTVEIDAASATDFNAIGDISDAQQVVFYNNTNTELAARVLDITLATRSIDTVNAEQSLVTQGFHFFSLTAAQLTTTKYLLAQTGQGGLSGDNARIGVANVSGTTVTYASAGELTPTDNNLQNVRASEIIALTSTTALWVYSEPVTDTANYARVVSIDGSDNVSEGVRVELSDDSNDPFCVVVFSATKALFVYQDVDDSDKLKGRILSISGTTITAETVVTIDDNRTWSLPFWSMTRVNSTKAALLAQDQSTTFVYGFVLTFNGTTSFSVGSEQGTFPVGMQASSFASNNDQRSIWGSRSGTTYTVYEMDIDVSANTISHTTSNDIDITVVNSSTRFPRLYTIATNHAMALTQSTADGTIVETTTATVATPGELTLSAMTKVADVDADGDFIYLGGINSLGFPTLIKFSTDLNADGTVVFNPGDGDNIGVQCGNFDADVIWIAGAFGGTDIVEKSEDGGSSFTVKDDGTLGEVSTFIVGSDSDERVLIIDELEDIYETINDGDTWTNYNTAVGLATLSVARLDKNLQELVLGNVANATINIQYSVNSGVDLEDYSSGFPEADVTGLTVGG